MVVKKDAYCKLLLYQQAGRTLLTKHYRQQIVGREERKRRRSEIFPPRCPFHYIHSASVFLNQTAWLVLVLLLVLPPPPAAQEPSVLRQLPVCLVEDLAGFFFFFFNSQAAHWEGTQEQKKKSTREEGQRGGWRGRRQRERH